MKRKTLAKPFSEMNAKELAEATAEFDREFISETFGPPDAAAKERYAKALRKRGRPRRGLGAKVISVTVEQSLLRRTDRLAKKLKLSRAQLIERGLRNVLSKAS